MKTFETEWYVEKKPSALIEFGDLGIDDTPYPHLLFASQADTERLCEAALSSCSARASSVGSSWSTRSIASATST